jgi:hypothetical protein
LLIQQQETTPGGPIPVPAPFLFRCDNDQREVILKSTVAEADHFLPNCGEQLRGAQSNVVPAKLNQSLFSKFLSIRIRRFG